METANAFEGPESVAATRPDCRRGRRRGRRRRAGAGHIAEGTQFGLGTLLLRYSRDYEKQADLLGAQIMARAGYDPCALAHAPSRSASIRLNKTATWFQMALFWSTNSFSRRKLGSSSWRASVSMRSSRLAGLMALRHE